jgi:hypothetical protein
MYSDPYLDFYNHTPCDGLRVIKCLLNVIDGAKWHTGNHSI